MLKNNFQNSRLSSPLERSLLFLLGGTKTKVEIEINILSNISSIEMYKENV